MPPHEGMQEYELTDNLLRTLAEARIKFDESIENQKESIDAQYLSYQNNLKKEQSMINDLVTSLEGVQSERGLKEDEDTAGIVHKKNDVHSRERKLAEFILDLTRRREEQDEVVRELKEKEVLYRGKANEAREHKARVEEAKATTIEDLTKGIINYNYLGFNFVKAPENGLCFSFTEIDKDDPKKTFSFTLGTNEYNEYEIYECNLNKEIVDELLHHLNKTDDLSYFVMQMRRAFLDML
eukprot:CAMPEP_0194234380 /NCGR_PEP_ID=MMETSP0158-20130606/2106_1 /TAXON_ID=33649 /ORGANISM="Thalassionema nitzschioides, Strain L26-B" /LENGTH=238 /DNA_ID=CAMNT_0038967529 /DNA_START=37 /DNA_END=753 /DNA_ORIENTATION=-